MIESLALLSNQVQKAQYYITYNTKNCNKITKLDNTKQNAETTKEGNAGEKFYKTFGSAEFQVIRHQQVYLKSRSMTLDNFLPSSWSLKSYKFPRNLFVHKKCI